MSSHLTCCGCWPTFIRTVQGTARPGRKYRRAKYNEREYSIEFENLIEEEDFYPPSQHIVTDVERDLLSRGKYGDLLQHESDMANQQEMKLKQKEENARLEDEAYIQAKMEASRVAKQAFRKKMNVKSQFPNMKKIDSVEFSKWLSEEKIDVTSPELDVEDFESFLEKVRAKSALALEETDKNKDATAFEQTLKEGLAATKIAGDALNALQPVELHAVGEPLFDENSHKVFNDPFASNSVIEDIEGNSANSVNLTQELSLDYCPVPRSQMAGDQLINISPLTDAEPLSEISTAQSFISSAEQSNSKVLAVDTTPAFNVSQLADDPEVPKPYPPIDSEISGIPTLNCIEIDAGKSSSDEILSTSPHISLDSSSLSSVTNTSNQQLIDVSPLNDDTQMLTTQVLAKYNHVNENEGSPEVQPKADNIESLENISNMQIENESCESDLNVPMTTVVTINTPRNIATNLIPVENIVTSPSLLTNEAVKMVPPSETLEGTEEPAFNSDDDFYDFDDDFSNSNSNGAFEDYLA